VELGDLAVEGAGAAGRGAVRRPLAQEPGGEQVIEDHECGSGESRRVPARREGELQVLRSCGKGPLEGRGAERGHERVVLGDGTAVDQHERAVESAHEDSARGAELGTGAGEDPGAHRVARGDRNGDKVGRFDTVTKTDSYLTTPTPNSAPCDLNAEIPGRIIFGEFSGNRLAYFDIPLAPKE
jgi:hypothetical protein